MCVGSGLATGWSPVQGVLPTAYRIKKLKIGHGAKDYRAIEERELVKPNNNMANDQNCEMERQ
jgi:hypothetical protein